MLEGQIVCKIKQAKFFAICADEVTDSSNKEQMPLVLRYLGADTQEIVEDFVAFVKCEHGITGRAIADYIINVVESLNLSLSDVRGQCYDGASNMSGKHRGAAALIQQEDGAEKAFTPIAWLTV